MKFVCEINSTNYEIHELKNVKIFDRLESESPSALLSALSFRNGNARGVPTIEQLLVHLFENKAAYAGSNYTIFISND